MFPWIWSTFLKNWNWNLCLVLSTSFLHLQAKIIHDDESREKLNNPTFFPKIPCRLETNELDSDKVSSYLMQEAIIINSFISYIVPNAGLLDMEPKIVIEQTRMEQKSQLVYTILKDRIVPSIGKDQI